MDYDPIHRRDKIMTHDVREKTENASGSEAKRARAGGLRRSARLLLASLALSTAALAMSPRALAQDAPEPLAADYSWRAAPPRPAEYEAGMRRTSAYVAMRDGVRLAIDVWLPVGLAPGARLPTILEQTRYYRSFTLSADPDGACRTARQSTVEFFVTRGYAYVVVDVRGSGASFGARDGEYSEAEIADGSDVLDWITRQPWSNGRVGSQGQSYVGTTAEFLASRDHPALEAIAPSFSGYDFYSEILFPGGVKNTEFAKKWSEMIAALDRAALPEGSPISSVCPVDGDHDRALLRAAIAEHQHNAEVWPLVEHTSFRDDSYQDQGIDQAGVFYRQSAIDQADIPVQAIVGWYDSGYALGALRRLATSSSDQNTILIGPWNHGGRYFYAPGVREPTRSNFDMAAEKLAFFDRILRDIGPAPGAPIRYFTTGANVWRDSASWPPRETRDTVLYFQAHGALTSRRPPLFGVDDYAADGAAQSGPGNRWRTTTGPYPVFYPDRADDDETLLTYETPPLDQALEVTGDPRLQLYLSTSARDADIFVYLEEVTARGEVNYVTEGVLRASHRRAGQTPFEPTALQPTHLRADAAPIEPGETVALDIALLPLSHQFAQGSRIRIALAPADRSHFREAPERGVEWRVFRSRTRPSHLVLPTADRTGGATAP